MFRTKAGTVLPFCFLFILAAAITGAAQEKKFGIVIHGGAGTILKSQMTPEKEAAYVAKLREALDTGYGILEKGGSSLDAVEAAIRILEDSPLFNAGKGAVFTADGINELDASIMDGKTLDAGAVACVKRIKNPISLSRMLMEKSEHVLLISEGAERFARDNGMALGRAGLFLHPGEMGRPPARQESGGREESRIRQGQTRDGGRCCPRQAGESRRRDFDRRDDQQEARKSRRFLDRRSRDVRQQRDLRRFLHGMGASTL